MTSPIIQIEGSGISALLLRYYSSANSQEPNKLTGVLSQVEASKPMSLHAQCVIHSGAVYANKLDEGILDRFKTAHGMWKMLLSKLEIPFSTGFCIAARKGRSRRWLAKCKKGGISLKETSEMLPKGSVFESEYTVYETEDIVVRPSQVFEVLANLIRADAVASIVTSNTVVSVQAFGAESCGKLHGKLVSSGARNETTIVFKASNLPVVNALLITYVQLGDDPDERATIMVVTHKLQECNVWLVSSSSFSGRDIAKDVVPRLISTFARDFQSVQWPKIEWYEYRERLPLLPEDPQIKGWGGESAIHLFAERFTLAIFYAKQLHDHLLEPGTEGRRNLQQVVDQSVQIDTISNANRDSWERLAFSDS